METIKFIDPETNEEILFSVEDETQINNIRYLLVSEADADADAEDIEAYILKEIQDEQDIMIYEMVSDDVEFEAVAKIFAELADEDTDLTF